MDKAGHYRKRSKETPKARKARKLQGYVQKREQGCVQKREIAKKNEREADIFFGCLFGVPFILVVLVVFILISKPMIPMCIIWIIGMLLEMALG